MIFDTTKCHWETRIKDFSTVGSSEFVSVPQKPDRISNSTKKINENNGHYTLYNTPTYHV